MAGTTNTTRVLGVPSGYPAEQVADLRIRVVDEDVLELSQWNELQMLKLFGGFSGAKDTIAAQDVNGWKYEWVLKDQWKQRTSVDNNPLASGGTSLTLTGEAHRYPKGTILQLGKFGDSDDPELVWVAAQVDADTLTIVRSYAGTTAAARASGDDVYVAGFSDVEGTDWVLRTTPVKSVAYNFLTMCKGAVQGSWINEAIARYGIPKGTDLAEQMADFMKQRVQAFNNQLLLGRRNVGASATDPSTMGGIDEFVTSANGAYVADLGNAPLTLKDLADMVENRVLAVGAENIGTTLVVDTWGWRKIQSFFDPGVRLDYDTTTTGLRVNKIRQLGVELDVLMDSAVPKGKMYLLRPDRVDIVKAPDGEHPSRLHIGIAGQTDEGDYKRMFIYGVYGMRVKNPETMGIIHSYSLTS